MRIFQTLLAEISDNTKKMAEGVYNLPSGASFFVPFQGYKDKNLNLGGGSGGAGTSTSTTPLEPGATPNVLNQGGSSSSGGKQKDADIERLLRGIFVKGPTGPSLWERSALNLPQYGPERPLTDLATKTSMPDRIMEKMPEVSTKLNLNITNNLSVLLDGRILATIIAPYQAESLVRYAGGTGGGRITLAK